MLTGKKGTSFGTLPPDRRKPGYGFARAAGSYVPKLTAKAFEKFGFHTAEIMTCWSTIAGEEIARWTQPERIRWPRGQYGADAADPSGRPGGTLVLRVEPARALDVEYRAAEVIDRINRYFGYRAVDTLKLIQAPISLADATMPPSAARPANGDRGNGGGEAAAQIGLERALQALATNLDRDRDTRNRR